MKRFLIPVLSVLLLVSCNGKQTPDKKPGNEKEPQKNIVIPSFNADSAYHFVKAQTDFGPRVPETKAHKSCGNWLVQQLSQYADTVMVQEFRMRIFNGKGMDGQNIIASFNPDAKKRIVLCAHWDSRPFADQEEDPAKWNTPIDGANDGASGTGVLMECARNFKLQPLNDKIGVDIVLFDLEDYGPRQDEAERYDEGDNWALGSQYWAKNPHIYGYKAYYGILLDMVGGSQPNFPKEYYSQGYAGWVLNKVWRTAHDLGYRPYFSNELGAPISDDHIPMNALAGIPTIDIIDLQPNSSNGCFPEMWHTLNDNISQINKETLGMVGDVLLHTVYNE